MKAYMIVKIIMKRIRIRIRIKMTTAILMTIMVGNKYQNNNDIDSNYNKNLFNTIASSFQYDSTAVITMIMIIG